MTPPRPPRTPQSPPLCLHYGAGQLCPPQSGQLLSWHSAGMLCSRRTCIAKAALNQDGVYRSKRSLLIVRHHDALASCQAVCLDHNGHALATDVLLCRRSVGKALGMRGGYAILQAYVLRAQPAVGRGLRHAENASTPVLLAVMCTLRKALDPSSWAAAALGPNTLQSLSSVPQDQALSNMRGLR